MSTFRIPKFTRPETFKHIEPTRLLRFLQPHRAYVTGRGWQWPPGPDDIDHDGLARIFLDPDEQMPGNMVEALYYVHELANEDDAEQLYERARAAGIAVAPREEMSCADLAVHVWLVAPDVLRDLHAGGSIASARNFEYFAGKRGQPRERVPTSDLVRSAIEADFDSWMDAHQRGIGSRIFFVLRGRKLWILVRHGLRLRREPSMREGKSSVAFFRPEVYHILAYDLDADDIGVSNTTKGERDLYLEVLGRHLFGDEAYFPPADKFSFDPLIHRGAMSLNCQDVPELECVQLVEAQKKWRANELVTDTRRCTDFFAALGGEARPWLASGDLTRVVFEVWFKNEKRSRLLTIRSRNIAKYGRDDDSEILEKWMQRRGFIRRREREENTGPPEAVGYR